MKIAVLHKTPNKLLNPNAVVVGRKLAKIEFEVTE